MSNYQHVIDSLTFVMGDKGVFDVVVDDALLYSKKDTGRHAEEGEVLSLFVDAYAQGVTPFGE